MFGLVLSSPNRLTNLSSRQVSLYHQNVKVKSSFVMLIDIYCWD